MVGEPGKRPEATSDRPASRPPVIISSHPSVGLRVGALYGRKPLQRKEKNGVVVGGKKKKKKKKLLRA